MRETFAQSEKMTADRVLSTLRGQHQLQSHHDPEADPDIDLRADSTIADWREACDLVKWKPLGRAMNESFHINHSDDEWYNVLEPKKKPLYGVCELIAKTAKQPKISPYNIGGEDNLAAGVFVALRTALQENGVDIENLRPSNRLNLDKDWSILYAVEMFAPETLPPIEYIEYEVSKISMVIDATLFFLMWASVLFGTVCWIFGFQKLVLFGCLVAAIASILLYLFTRIKKSPKAYMGNLQTVGDICRYIADRL